MIRTHKSLDVCHLDVDSHRRTCGYWFTVTSGCTAHTAFATRRGLNLWLAERGLTLASPIDMQPSHAFIIGEYRTRSYLHDAADFYGLKGLETRTLSNGDYVRAIITTDDDGIRTVHTLNPNIRDRQVFDYRESNKLMS